MNHTLIIPTYNRPAFMRKLAGYYRERMPDVGLLVLDSSEPDIAAANRHALARHGDAVRHHVFPGDTPPGSKVASGLERVDTPYVSLCADDDLVFPEALHRSVAFLEKHADYACSHGLSLGFRVEGATVHLARDPAGPSNEASHAGARIFRMLQKYESIYYAVFRSADLRAIFAALPSLKTLAFQELYQGVATAIKGKIGRTAQFHALRNAGPPAHAEREKWQTHYWYAQDPAGVLEHYRAYRDALWSFYDAHGDAPKMDQPAFFRLLDLAHTVYLSSGCPPAHFYAELQTHWPDDAYVATGSLEYAREAQIPSFLNLDGGTARADLLDALRTPRDSLNFKALRALAALWYFAWSIPGQARLSYEVRKECVTAWRCRPSHRIRWIAAVPQFREAFVELCRYLDYEP